MHERKIVKDNNRSKRGFASCVEEEDWEPPAYTNLPVNSVVLFISLLHSLCGHFVIFLQTSPLPTSFPAPLPVRESQMDFSSSLHFSPAKSAALPHSFLHLEFLCVTHKTVGNTLAGRIAVKGGMWGRSRKHAASKEIFLALIYMRGGGELAAGILDVKHFNEDVSFCSNTQPLCHSASPILRLLSLPSHATHKCTRPHLPTKT